MADNKITLQSSSGFTFEISNQAFKTFGFDQYLKEGGSENPIVELLFKDEILTEIVAFCEKSVEDGEIDDAWIDEFVESNKKCLFYLLEAAGYLKIESLVDRLTKIAAYEIHGKTEDGVKEAIKKYFP